MENTVLCIIVISIMLLLGLTFHSFLSKTPMKGKTLLKWKIALYKILQIEFEYEHENNCKN